MRKKMRKSVMMDLRRKAVDGFLEKEVGTGNGLGSSVL